MEQKERTQEEWIGVAAGIVVVLGVFLLASVYFALSQQPQDIVVDEMSQELAEVEEELL